MRNVVFIIILMALCYTTSAQSININNISTDADALAFVKQENYDKTDAPQWNHFYLTDGTEWKDYYNFSNRQVDSIQQNMSVSSWQKVDLNQDGKPDLIISGYIARRPKDWTTASFKLLVFLSDRGNGNIQMNLIDDKLDKYPAYFSIISLNQMPYLQLYRWHLSTSNLNDVPLRRDTLQYDATLNYFVQHSDYLNPLEIQQIDYVVQENHSGDYHLLSIENRGSNSFPISISFKDASTKTPVNYKARLTKELWNSIDTLVRNIRFTRDTIVYNDETEGDKLPIILSIRFSDSSIRSVKDYDANASYTLMSIYQIFESIISNTLDLYEQRQQQLQQMNDDDW